MFKYVAVLLIAIVVIVLAASRLGGKSNEISGVNDVDLTINTVEPNYNLTRSAWIPNWATASGLSSLKANAKVFESISPVWYEVNEDGSLKSNFPAQSEELLKSARTNKIKVIPTIAMFDHELFTKAFESEEALKRHIDAIITEVRKYNYDGIDLDYESTKLVDKDKYFTILQSLSEKLHAVDKELVVSVLAKWGDDVNYPSLPETRQVQDWSEISKYADEIRIMAYDYTSSSAKSPGPIAPVSWIEKILTYAVRKMPREKIVLGVHLYSYEWSSSLGEQAFQPDFYSNQISSTKAASYTYDAVRKILNATKGEKMEFEGEQIFIYSINKEGKKYFKMLVYIDPQGVLDREALASRFGIKGVTYWRLGGEGDLLQKD